MPDPQGGQITTVVGRARQMQGGNQFGFGFYGPGNPLPAVVEGMPIRQWDFNPGVNTTQTPRHIEPFNFRHLRAFSNVELVRMAIETRKDQLSRLEWMVKPRDNQAARSKERDPRCLEVEKFLAKPDGQTLFPDFMRWLDEDLLALDAACLERVRTRGGKLYGLELVDGSTINLLVNDQGRRPREPLDIAYQQVIRGIVWGNLANRDLLYLPRNVRSGHIYGFGPVEQIIVTINTIIRRQARQLAYFTEGNVPAGLLNAPAGWTNEQIRDLQAWFDQRIKGNPGEQNSLIWGPEGSKYTAFKDAPIKDEFDEWLARLVAFAFSLPPTPFIRQMNKGTAGEDQDRAEEEGLEPLKLWRKRWLDDLIASEFGYADLEFEWREDVDLDPGKQAEIDDRNLKNGSSSIDEVRDGRGQDPLPNGLGARPMIYLGDSPIPLESIDALIERKTAPPEPMAMPGSEPGDEGGNQPPANGKGKKPAAPKAKPEGEPAAEKIEKAAKIPPAHALALSIDRPKAMRAIAALARAIKPILEKASHDAAAQIERSLEKAERDPNIKAKRLAESIDLRILLGLRAPLEEELELIGLDAGGLALASIGVDEASDLVNQVNARAVAYAKERAGELVSVDGDESLIASTREMIRRIIADGLEQNIGRDAIAENIQDSAAFGEYRADLIANTEIANANSAGKGAAWDEARADGALMVKQWFASGEEGVCVICEGNEAQDEIAFDEAFESGDEMEPAHPGCRCVTTARVLDPGESGAEGDGSGEEE